MASFPFQIEFIDPQGRYVLARHLEPHRPFRLGAGSRLGECEVGGVSQPRALSPDGTPRRDIFGFRLRGPASVARLRVGQTVELRADQVPPAPAEDLEE